MEVDETATPVADPEPSGPTPPEPAEPSPGPPAPEAPPAPEPGAAAGPTPVVLDNFTRRNDADVLQGHFARIGAGEHEGKIGVFTGVVSTDADGYPDEVHVELRNTGEIVTVAHADLIPTDFGGR